MVDPKLIKCKWSKFSHKTMEMWRQYILIVKRGNSPLIQCPPHLYDVAECELIAEGNINRKKREKEATEKLLKERGLIK